MIQLFPWTLDAQRKRLLKRAPAGPLRDFLKVAPPEKNTPLKDTPILSVDVETTGFDYQLDQILSIGFVAIDKLSIPLASSSHQIIRLERNLDDANVIIHKITDSAKNAGVPAEQAIGKLLENLAGKVLLAHYAKTEVNFIRQSCLALYGLAPVFPVIDTLQIAAQRMTREQRQAKRKELRLFRLRERYGLPEYAAHNALGDALSAAELFLAEVPNLPDGPSTRLSKILVRP
ncbi:MAG: DNA polymerase III subunit epsilon [Gammaproteobacteria bacterium]|nr:DNA polymerase III subunit epsilon [Gammaproteobacteria bacterium]